MEREGAKIPWQQLFWQLKWGLQQTCQMLQTRHGYICFLQGTGNGERTWGRASALPVARDFLASFAALISQLILRFLVRTTGLASAKCCLVLDCWRSRSSSGEAKKAKIHEIYGTQDENRCVMHVQGLKPEVGWEIACKTKESGWYQNTVVQWSECRKDCHWGEMHLMQ